MMRKIFTNNDFGAPGSISQTPGSALAVLQACLIDGFGDQTPTSITRVGTTATMILPNAHGFTRTGVFNISGCDQADYNGEFRVTVVNSTTVTFTVANSPVTPATGTIVCRQDDAGWTMPFTDTNKAVFKQGVASNGLYLNVDDTLSTAAKVRGYEAMTAVDTGTAPFPTVAQEDTSYWAHGNATSDWVVVADSTFVLLWTPENSIAYNTAGAWFFGDYRTAAGTGSYNTLISGSNLANQAYYSLLNLDATSASGNGRWVARDYDELGDSRAVSIVANGSMSKGASGCSSLGMDYPEPLTNNVYIQELMIFATAGANNLIGYIDGAYSMHHQYPFGLTEHSYFAGSGAFENEEFIYMPGTGSTALVFRISE